MELPSEMRLTRGFHKHEARGLLAAAVILYLLTSAQSARAASCNGTRVEHLPPALAALAHERDVWLLRIPPDTGADRSVVVAPPGGRRMAVAAANRRGGFDVLDMEPFSPGTGYVAYDGPPTRGIPRAWTDGRPIYFLVGRGTGTCITVVPASMLEARVAPAERDFTLVYFGLLVALAGLYLTLAVGSRESHAIFYVAYLAALLFYQSVRLNVIWGLVVDRPWISPGSVETAGFALVLVTHLLFARAFLRTRENEPLLDAYLRAIAVFVVVWPTIELVGTVFGVDIDPYTLGLIFSMIAIGSIVTVVIVRRIRAGDLAARIFFASYVTLFTFSLIAFVEFIRHVRGPLFVHGTEFGTALEAILLGFAVGERLRSERRLNAVVNSLGEVVLRTDRLGRCLWLSPNALELTGLDPRTIATHITPLSFVSPTDRARAIDAVRRALRRTTRSAEARLCIDSPGGPLTVDALISVARVRGVGRVEAFQISLRIVAPGVAPSAAVVPNAAVAARAAVSPSSPADLRVSVFGGYVVRGTQVLALTPREFELVAIAAIGGGVARRDAMLAAMWPDLDDGSAANTLHVTLSRVRRKLGDRAAIESDRHGVRLAAGVETDIAQLRSDLLALAPAVIERLRDDVSRPFSAALLNREWFASEQLQLEILRRNFLFALGERQLTSGAFDDALAIAQALRANDATDESGYALAISANIACGDELAAMRAYADCRATLIRELGVEPSAGLNRAVAKLFRRAI